MKYIKYAVVGLVVLFSTAYAEIQELGNGQYVAIIQSDTSQTGPNWNRSVWYYMQVDTIYDTTGQIIRIDTTTNYEDYSLEALTGSYSYYTATNRPMEKFRNWHEFSLWEIPDNAVIDSVKLVITGFFVDGDSISIDVVNLNGNRPSLQSPQELWNHIGNATVYVNDTKIYWDSFEPKWKLPGAENTIQSRLGTADEWFATGFRSNWENRDSVLLDAPFVELWVYFRVKPQVHVDRPNGGEIFYISLEDTIRWTASDYDNYVNSVDILLSRDGGVSYTLIGQVYNTQHSNPWSGKYVWPVTGPESDQCKVKVIAYDTDGLSGADASDDVFSIEILPPPEVELLWPNEPGIVVEEADTYAIRYNGDAVAGIEEVEAWFSYDGGQTWQDSIESRSYSSSITHVENDTIEWVVTQHPTEHGRVKVVLYDAANQTAVDISQYDITILPARPGNFTASISPDYNSVSLAWTDRSNYEDGYEVWRKTAGDSSWIKIATLPANSTTYIDSSISIDKIYAYKIRAFFNNSGLFSNFTSPYLVSTYITQFTTSNSPGTRYNNGKNIVYRNGEFHLVYSDGNSIMYTHSSDGESWSTPVVISGDLDNCMEPSVTVSGNGKLLVVFKSGKTVYFTEKDNNWTSPYGLNKGNALKIWGPTIAENDGEILVAWIDSSLWYNRVVHRLKYVKIEDGISYPEEMIDTVSIPEHGAEGYHYPVMVANDNEVLLIYLDGENLVYRRYEDGDWSDKFIIKQVFDHRYISFNATGVGNGIGMVVYDDGMKYREYKNGSWGSWETVPGVSSDDNYTYELPGSYEEVPIDVSITAGNNAVFVVWNVYSNDDEENPWFQELNANNLTITRVRVSTRHIGLWANQGYLENWYVRGMDYPACAVKPMSGMGEYKLVLATSKVMYEGDYSNATGFGSIFYWSKDYQLSNASPHEGEEESGELSIRMLGIRNGSLELISPRSMKVEISIYDVGGRKVRGENEIVSRGRNLIRMDLGTGVYFAVLKAGKKVLRKRFVVLK